MGCPFLFEFNGAPGKIRTCDPMIRSLNLMIWLTLIEFVSHRFNRVYVARRFGWVSAKLMSFEELAHSRHTTGAGKEWT
jgi:hypothetical protein